MSTGAPQLAQRIVFTLGFQTFELARLEWADEVLFAHELEKRRQPPVPVAATIVGEARRMLQVLRQREQRVAARARELAPAADAAARAARSLNGAKQCERCAGRELQALVRCRTRSPDSRRTGRRSACPAVCARGRDDVIAWRQPGQVRGRRAQKKNERPRKRARMNIALWAASAALAHAARRTACGQFTHADLSVASLGGALHLVHLVTVADDLAVHVGLVSGAGAHPARSAKPVNAPAKVRSVFICTSLLRFPS